MNTFVDAEHCETQENTDYYTKLDLANETLARPELRCFFESSGFTAIKVDEDALVEPLQFDIFVASPASILA